MDLVSANNAQVNIVALPNDQLNDLEIKCREIMQMIEKEQAERKIEKKRQERIASLPEEIGRFFPEGHIFDPAGVTIRPKDLDSPITESYFIYKNNGLYIEKCMDCIIETSPCIIYSAYYVRLPNKNNFKKYLCDGGVRV